MEVPDDQKASRVHSAFSNNTSFASKMNHIQLQTSTHSSYGTNKITNVTRGRIYCHGCEKMDLLLDYVSWTGRVQLEMCEPIGGTHVEHLECVNASRKFLRIVLSIEDKLNYLEQPILSAPVAPKGQLVAPEITATHTAWIKGSKGIARLMLMTMEPDIQRNMENLHAHEMLEELKTLFAQRAEQELL
ncbi:hypothetical protein Tco_0771521 [Tanacetum coccineum]|uniref:Zinc finger, CCHC-type n=1 Tax=Tanacetum coccineum TaxID=301880 RepID=A0ABQ4ZIM9_9ASTR